MFMPWWVAWQGVRVAAQIVDKGKSGKIPAFMAKVFATEAALRICDEAIQLLGGYGYMTDHKVEQNYRDARLLTVGEGTSEILELAITERLDKANFALDDFDSPLETVPDGTRKHDGSSPEILSLARDALLFAVGQIKQHESNGGPPFNHQSTEVQVARMATKLWVAMQALHGTEVREHVDSISQAGSALASAFAKDAAIEISQSAMDLLGTYGHWDERLAETQRRIYQLVVRDGPSEVKFSDLAERILG
jgi:alkylation response protein AidB-like acyl-CoA dehydrogenase